VPIYITGLREISGAYGKLERETRLGMRAKAREIAAPVQHTAEALAQAKITRIGRRWFKMRIGVTRTLIYVAPRQRGVKGRGPDPRRRGQQFANLLMDKAMEPALEQNEAKIEHAVDELLDHVIADFNR
jgi:hypothetical protein